MKDDKVPSELSRNSLLLSVNDIDKDVSFKVSCERFDEEKVQNFEKHPEYIKTIACLFFFSMSVLWPYQTYSQAQSEVTTRIGDADLTTYGFVCSTVPYTIFMFVNFFVGQLEWFDWSTRANIGYGMFVVASVFWLLCYNLVTDNSTLTACLYITGVTISLGQAFAESTVYMMAGMLPSNATTIAVMSGNGFAGVLVQVIAIICRFIWVGNEAETDSQSATLNYFYFGILIVVSIVAALLNHLYFCKTDIFKIYVSDLGNSATKRRSVLSEKPQSVGKEDSTRQRFYNLGISLKHSWKYALCITLCYSVTLSLWPVIPFSACVRNHEDVGLNSWWISIILVTYNVGDFISKSEPWSLKWGTKHMNGNWLLGISIGRLVLFFPLIILMSGPQKISSYVAAYALPILTFLMGYTNGWLSTVAFMRGPRTIDSNLNGKVAEYVNACLVMGLYFGLASGAGFSIALVKILDSYLGVCHA